MAARDDRGLRRTEEAVAVLAVAVLAVAVLAVAVLAVAVLAVAALAKAEAKLTQGLRREVRRGGARSPAGARSERLVRSGRRESAGWPPGRCVACPWSEQGIIGEMRETCTLFLKPL
jgi:hypothetical protein